jgi:predicted RNA-binding protein YlxR (DUF448 family)
MLAKLLMPGFDYNGRGAWIKRSNGSKKKLKEVEKQMSDQTESIKKLENELALLKSVIQDLINEKSK